MSPKAREKRSAIQKEAQNSPKVKAKHSLAQKRRWADSEERVRIVEAINAPEAKAKKRASALIAQHRSDVKEKHRITNARPDVHTRRSIACSISKQGQRNPRHIIDRSHVDAKGYPLSFIDIAAHIRDRDNHVCFDCGKTEEENSTLMALDVHHIDFDKDNSDPTNLITLCRQCHKRRHVEERNRQNV